MLEKFTTYQLAKELYRRARGTVIRGPANDQLQRACLSVVLNLAEGSAKISEKERQRFYQIAFGSIREVQALIEVEPDCLSSLWPLADQLGACLYRLSGR